jgi:hypothetical protein
MLSVLAVTFAVTVFVGQAYLAGRVARRKGRPFWLYFAAALIVGPLALVGALLLPRHRFSRLGRV